MGVTKIPKGSAPLRITNPESDVFRKYLVVSICNDDALCMALALVVAWAHANRVDTDVWKSLRVTKGLNLETRSG